jgi:hypothetical protein
MPRHIGAMIQPLALLAAVLASKAGTSVFVGEEITVTVGVTPSCPYGLAG